ncbi:membrane protein [Bacteroidia bacterium]|nr:membrane protein [Bacteroidia bacterium]
MPLSLFIAKRYLFAKTSHNVIHWVSLISAVGMAVGAFALIVVLSVYNGMDSFVGKLYSTLSPPLKITAVQGKVFDLQNVDIQQIVNTEGIIAYSASLEENGLLKYNDKLHIATLCGVDDVFLEQSGIAQTLVEGAPILQQGDVSCAIAGRTIAQTLDLHPQFLELLWIYLPQRGKQVSTLNIENAFKRTHLRTTGVFSVEMESDARYVFVPLALMQNLLNYEHEVSSLSLYLQPQADEKKAQQVIQKIVGNSLKVQTKAEQNDLLYKMMASEKWAIFFILIFVLLVASFNSIGSLTMLILEKKKDIGTLYALGAQSRWLGRIFVSQGMMIAVLGCTAGVVLGLLTCGLQIHFKIIKLTGNFLLDAYPVQVQAGDIVLIFAVVMFIGYVASLLPVRFLLRASKTNQNSTK